MKKILLTATILASFAGAAFAANTVSPVAPAKSPVVAPAPLVTGKATDGKTVVALTKEQVAAIDAKCKKEHANVMSPEYKACVTTETKNASMPKSETEGEGEVVAPTEAPAVPSAPASAPAPVAPATKAPTKETK
jgi:hypothetical protein